MNNQSIISKIYANTTKVVVKIQYINHPYLNELILDKSYYSNQKDSRVVGKSYKDGSYKYKVVSIDYV